ncbi:endonuclease III [Thiotrichales bacterium 19X7-9]|nr:endonuclease III [Thiotrichales bacterium 19X7-9]
MNKTKIKRIFELFKANNEKPTTELTYQSTFELLISVILSAQATDVSVNKATDKLYPVANSPETILALGEDGLIEYIKSIGLYRSKAKNIIKTCQMLIEKHNCKVPDNRKALESLPGVGRKTANVILNTAFNQPTMAVDTHIFRLSNRLNLAPGKTVNQVEDNLLKVIPKAYLQDAHHWLILHGRYTCKARKPLCDQCIIYKECEFKDKVLYKGD